MRIELTVDGAPLEVSELEGYARVDRPFAFELRAFARENAPELTELVGRPFVLLLVDRFDQTISFHGIVLETERSGSSAASFRLRLGPRVSALAVGMTSRVYQCRSAVDVVVDVLRRGAIADADVVWRLAESHAARDYVAQYCESDWSFVERLLAEEGITYLFEHEDDATRLVLTDDTTTARAIDGDEVIPFSAAEGLHATRDCVVRVRRAAELAPDAVRVRDYDPDKPRLELDSKDGSGEREVFDVPGRFGTPADGDLIAKRWRQALRARVLQWRGDTSSTRVACGRVFELDEHPLASMNGRLFITEVRYRAKELRHDRALGLTMEWVAIPAGTPHRPARRAIVRSPRGPQTAVVVGAAGSEIHPNGSGRVRAQFHWDREGRRDDSASTWMRVGQVPLGGSMVLPRVGWDVLVGHFDGDIDRPYVASHLYDGAFPVPYRLPDHATRTAWQTATTPGGGSVNEIRFEDRKGAEEMFLNASYDMNVVVGDAKTEKVGATLTESIGANLSVDIGSNLKVGIVSAQTTTIGANESLVVSGSRAVNVTAAESTMIGGSRDATIGGGATLDATGGRSLVVGGALMGMSADSISRTVLGSLSLSVGGAWLQAAGSGVSSVTGGATSESIGGAKISAAGEGVATSVRGAMVDTVGGALVVAAGGDVGDGAGGALSFAVGGAFVADAPSIEVEAGSEITIRCGGSSLTITSSRIELKSPSIGAPGAVVKKKAGSVKHN